MKTGPGLRIAVRAVPFGSSGTGGHADQEQPRVDHAADRLAETLAVADGVIVGTSLKVDGITWNPVDPARARRFMDTARQARSAPAVAS